MIKYKIIEHIKTINIYKLDLNDEFVQKLNVKIQTEYANEQGQTIPYIDLDVIKDIINFDGDLDEINRNREVNHKAPLKDFEIKNRNLPNMSSWSLYELVRDMISEYAWDSVPVEQLDSYVDEWHAELKDEEED